jgi:hypothetical protein
MQVFDDRFQAESGVILTLLGSGHQKHVEFYNRINLDN